MTWLQKVYKRESFFVQRSTGYCSPGWTESGAHRWQSTAPGLWRRRCDRASRIQERIALFRHCRRAAVGTRSFHAVHTTGVSLAEWGREFDPCCGNWLGSSGVLWVHKLCWPESETSNHYKLWILKHSRQQIRWSPQSLTGPCRSGGLSCHVRTIETSASGPDWRAVLCGFFERRQGHVSRWFGRSTAGSHAEESVHLSHRRSYVLRKGVRCTQYGWRLYACLGVFGLAGSGRLGWTIGQRFIRIYRLSLRRLDNKCKLIVRRAVCCMLFIISWEYGDDPHFAVVRHRFQNKVFTHSIHCDCL